MITHSNSFIWQTTRGFLILSLIHLLVVIAFCALAMLSIFNEDMISMFGGIKMLMTLPHWQVFYAIPVAMMTLLNGKIAMTLGVVVCLVLTKAVLPY